MRCLLLALGLLAAAPHDAGVQPRADERALVARGMYARITRGGIYPPQPSDLRDTAVALYPGVRFYYADVALEHGGSFRLYGAVDTAGQLYLLDSPASFRLLHRAHFRGGEVDSATAVTIALLASRFGGLLPAKFALKRVEGFLMRAVSGNDATLVPFAWSVTLDVEVDRAPARLAYEVWIRGGAPHLMSRECGTWCRTTILEP